MPSSVKQKALAYLARRDHSSLELRQKLARAGFDEESIQQTLDMLMQKNWLSDQRFAEQYTSFRAAKGVGPLRIAQELQVRGIDKETINHLLNSREWQWTQRASEARCKRFGSTIPNDWPTRAKQQRFLYTRGFSQQQIQEVLEGMHDYID